MSTRTVWRRHLQYPAQATALALAIVCLAGALLLGGIAWRTLAQLDAIGAQLEHSSRLQRANGLLHQLLADRLAGAEIPDREGLAQLRRDIEALRIGSRELHEATADRLSQIEGLLGTPGGPSAQQLERSARLLRNAAVDEADAHSALLKDLRSEARAELETALGLFAGLAALGLAAAWIMQRRIVRPLTDLRNMFQKLERRDFSAIPVERLHPALVPLFENYNRLVRRLEELEKEHRSRAADLEGEVRTATEALLDQQRSLARAERLAAVGEMAASLAHELRNPLAGVQLTLSNLRGEISDPEVANRLDLAIAEVDRLARLLSQQLSGARHVPEPPGPLDLRTLLTDLVALVRYQVPECVKLEIDVGDDLTCVLPRDRLRQALLNLILNSVQALQGESGSVWIRARRENQQLVLTVSDDGPGFPPELAASSIQAFVTRRPGGTGLGLAMVRRLVLDLGGEISLENLVPRGAHVRLALPCPDA